MHWTQRAAATLARTNTWAYHAGGPAATEPAALAAIALMRLDQPAASSRALRWLAQHQARDGSLGITAEQAQPTWPTSLALLAWSAAAVSNESTYASNIDRATKWLLSAAGDPVARNEQLGHDSTLVGWPWVQGTHSWVEPTAWSVVALKRVGMTNHPRVREAVRLLLDRLFPGGGSNYGNTFVLGQLLRPHLAPSGVALMALVGENDESGRIARTLSYVEREVNSQTTTMSLCHALLGLAAHQRQPKHADEWLAASCQRTLDSDKSPYKLALLLAALSGSLTNSPTLQVPA